MPLDLHGLQIDSVVVHEVRRGAKGAGTTVLLSDRLSALTPDLCEFFQNKIIGAASSDDSFRAEFIPDTPSPVPGLCDGVLRGGQDLLHMSQEAARHLARVQPGASSSGLLVVATGTHTNASALIFLKVEHDQGVKLQRRQLPGGVNVMELEHIRDLMLSTRTRLHKQAFIQYADEGYFLEVADRQRGFESTTDVAQFFLSKFLGAQTKVDARAATKRFVEAVAMVVDGVQDPKRQTEIRLDLATELNSRRSNLVPRTFARDHLKIEELGAFDEAMIKRSVPANFAKDTALVEKVVARLRVIGEHGVAVSAPTEAWTRIAIGDPDRVSGESTLTVRDRFKVEP